MREAEPAYEHAEALGYTLTVGETEKKKRDRRRDQFAAEITCFSDCVLQGKEPEPSAEDGCWDVRIVNALYESAEKGRPVTLGQFEGDKAPDGKQAGDFPPLRQEPELVAIEKPHD